MHLILPGVGTEDGPQYATDVNSSLTLVDQHDHSIGAGVPVTPAGLNINADLPINNNNLTLARTIRFQPQPSDPALAADLGILYEVGVDLYYRDGSGNAIRITQGGAVTGASGTTSASFAASTFVFQAATLTGANIDGASHIFRNNTPSSFGLTLSPPNAMAADYSLILPALPASTKIMALDSAGNMAAVYSVDNSSIEISSNIIQVKDGGITRPKLAPLGQQVSTGSGAFTTSSTGYVDVTGLTVSITTSGRPIFLMVTGDPGFSNSNISVITISGTAAGNIRLLRDGANSVTDVRLSGPTPLFSAPNVLSLDAQPAGTYNYRVQVKADGGTTIGVNNCNLTAYELF